MGIGLASASDLLSCSSGDLGGQMGLFIGASILTLLEILDYIYEARDGGPGRDPPPEGVWRVGGGAVEEARGQYRFPGAAGLAMKPSLGFWARVS